jgi:L-methionine (R)-S-oxide reductase
MQKREKYNWAAKKVRAQVLRSVDPISALANTAAILKENFDNYFWVGFYFVKEDCLLLGPFQGPPACVKLGLDKGVCAACAKTKKSVIVPNVHEFAGHVACDERSSSEIVVPVFSEAGQITAVLDVDSEKLNDFDDVDRQGLKSIAALLKGLWPVRGGEE